jgi:dipeptidase D
MIPQCFKNPFYKAEAREDHYLYPLIKKNAIMSVFRNLKPEPVWQFFEDILKIPRPSNEEEKIREYLVDFAQSRSLDHQVDKAGNLIIRKGAAPGMENRKSVVLQSHMDMVCEKNSDVEFDFRKDPIIAWLDGGWVKARGTTLGADDGIGIAAQLAVLDARDIAHGPVECLFTVAEETGLTGAFGLEEGFIKSSILLNLDSEDEGELFIGCAGGGDLTAIMDYREEQVPDNYTALRISITGLQGGHSGDDIHKGLANSNKLLARLLWEISDEFDLHISDFEGGNLRNAIAREAHSTVLVPAGKLDGLMGECDRFREVFLKEYSYTEPKLKLEVQRVENPDWVIDEDTQANLLNAIYSCPHGVHAWSHAMPGMVETSTNLAAVKFIDGRIVITTSQRSSVETAKKDIANMVQSTFLLAGAETERSNGYPGWNPNPDSAIVRITSGIYKKLFGVDPVVRSIHAGLECGLFLEKYPHLDMISFGPTIKGAHSPDERLDIITVKKFWDLLLEVLLQIPYHE